MTRVAIVGCGQLARMLALAGWPLGFQFSFLAEAGESDDCVRGLGPVVYRNAWTHISDLYRALGSPQVITVEKEHVDIELLRTLKQFCAVRPDTDIIRVCRHRGREKQFLADIGVPAAPFAWIDGVDDLPFAADQTGFPLIVKTCEMGYDGQNQWRLQDMPACLNFVQSHPGLRDLIVESQIDFSRELSLIVIRSTSGAIEAYPPTENRHRNGILLSSIAPAKMQPGLHEQLVQIQTRILDHWDYVGVLTIECFEASGRILVNELAPRVHNSGHWTQQGCATSQFENHLRAITGMTPGNTRPHGHAAMVNLLGLNAPQSLWNDQNANIHLYNKIVRPGRKVGHINLYDQDRTVLQGRLHRTLETLYGPVI